MLRRIQIVLLVICFSVAGQLTAQNPNNALLYSNQAVLFGDQGSANDPVSIIMPGTAFKSGLGSFIDNPASLALYRESIGEFGMSFRTVNEDATYIGQSRSVDDRQNNVSNFGFLYSFPTVQGSFVIGAAYTQHSVYNRTVNFRAQNNNNTITDKFKAPGSSYQDIAFDTYATDYGDGFEDWDESIFRIGFDNFGDFLGIRQQGEITQTGYSGEYSLFFATEFQENLMIGGSLGIHTGRYNYNRIFQEIDEDNVYDSPDFLDSSGDGVGDTDIHRITLGDRLDSRYSGFRARLGLLYKLNENINVGGSYTFRSTIEVDEKFDADIVTRFDNNREFSASTDSEFSYKIIYPSRAALGVGIKDIAGLSVSVSTEYIDYSDASIDFNESDLFDSEQLENDFIRSSFRSVWNFRIGSEYKVSELLTLRGGYSYKPSRFLNGSDHRNIFAAGAGVSLTRNIRFQIAAQYEVWDEVSSLYDYAQYDYTMLPDAPPGIQFSSQEISRSVDRWNVLGTLRVRL